jgi:CrcB protein
MQAISIAMGGALGALMRFWLSTAVYAWLGRQFPWGTLSVNVLGSFLMGLLAMLLLERFSSSPEVRAFLLIGFLGAFTTFSTFSMETMNLLEQGETVSALLNIAVSIVACLSATGLGILLGRSL